MDVKFTDKLLKCFDCHEEFVFTAGEQLFFCDKQFKNDPKRCKPCKAKRGGMIPKAGTGALAPMQRRTETRTRCSACSIETTVPFKPTQGRPVLCRECFQAKARLPLPPATTVAATPYFLAQTRAAALTALSINSNGAVLNANAAVLAASSMVTAPAHSSVATASDLASISGPASVSEPEIRSSAATRIDHVEMIPIGVVEPTRPETSVAQELLVLDPETVWA